MSTHCSILTVFIISIIGICQAKVFTACEFVTQLKNNDITSRADLGTWACIASHESNFNTQAVNSATNDYGILQISEHYWCNLGSPGKGCGITCESLLDDDITNDIKCAKTVFDETVKLGKNGFDAWTTYQYCQGDQTGYLSGCNI